MIPSQPEDSEALAALSELLRDSPRPPREPELERGLFALRSRMAAARVRVRARLRWSVLVAALVGCVALGGLGLRALRAPAGVETEPVALARIEGGKLLDGGYLSESGHSGVTLRFNEGSEFRLLPGARGRLRDVNGGGARLALEHGVASFHITRSPSHHWSVEAGPFSIAITGTEFSVSWDPQREQFGVRLRRGRVVISGPVLGEDLALRAGQALTVNLPAAETVITELRADDAESEASFPHASPPATSAAPATTSSGKVEAPSAASSQAVASASGRRWSEAMARGLWDRILGDVEREGVNATLQSASSEELVALADAARYRRRADLARSALLAQRRRFPGSPRALDALFLLGRVEELRASGRAAAIGWYDQYLSQAPAGTYASEALGRKMVLSSELGGPALARPLAEEYLRRFPRGSYAGAARAFRSGP
jgi:hypothetical protein